MVLSECNATSPQHLPAHTIHVYGCHIPPLHALRAQLWPLLDPEERAAYAARRIAHAQDSYLCAHALCRLALSRYERLAPSAWRYRREPGGKPMLAASHASPWHFTVSHTKGFVACAVARLQVGIDVERGARPGNLRALQRRVLTEREQQNIAADPNFEVAFLRLWTCKEATLKAHGLGLSYGPRNLEVTQHAQGTSVQDMRAGTQAPTFVTLLPGDASVIWALAAVAAESDPPCVVHFDGAAVLRQASNASEGDGRVRAVQAEGMQAAMQGSTR